MLSVPDRFNKNAPSVQALGSPAETGAWLLGYMCDRIGITDLADSDVLDFGCGCRFVDAIINRGVNIKSYTGIDVDREMIDFLRSIIKDQRFLLFWWDVYNPIYNPNGMPIQGYETLPIGGRTFDIICMFSVITHQLPEDASAIFRLLRGCVRPGGHLFFSAMIEDVPEGYAEMAPEQPAARSAYSLPRLRALLERAGWQILSVAGKRPLRADGYIPIQDSLLCAPAPTPKS